MFQLNMDCEGPLTQNDNAFELCQHFIPQGGKFFSLVSKYDDFLADVVRKPGYKAGDTLKLVLPFLKAYGVSDKDMEEFSQRTLVLLPGTDVMLPKVNGLAPSFIISTSYRPYIEALCKVTGFPMENCYCTQVTMDDYPISESEVSRLKDIAAEIASMQMLQWPDEAKGLEDLAEEHQRNIKRLNEIFWEIIPSMSVGIVMEKVNPVGGSEKARAVQDSLKRTGKGADRVIYAGDSITDTQALELVNGAGGVAISFNGNKYALRSAEYALLSDNTCILYGLTDLVSKRGKAFLDGLPADEQAVVDIDALIRGLEEVSTNQEVLDQIRGSREKGTLEIYRVSGCDLPSLIAKSERFRKEVRGFKVGELG